MEYTEQQEKGLKLLKNFGKKVHESVASKNN
jgi:hypothetical protein